MTGIDEMNDVEAPMPIAAVEAGADVGIPADLKGILKEEDVQFWPSRLCRRLLPGQRDTSVEGEIKELYRSLM